MSESKEQPSLVRALGFWTLAIYGVGDILGAGIYALIGEVAGLAGSLSWLAFLIAVVVAAFTGCSYAELARRFPSAGGEACYCEQAFRRPKLAFLAGWAVFCSGLVSMATVSRAFAGYFTSFDTGAPEWLVVVAFICIVGLITVVGIRISSQVNVACTLVETSGLLLVIVCGLWWLFASDSEPPIPSEQAATSISLLNVLQAATLAFFAFIGFEDMVKMSEEVRDPKRTVPRAILTAVVVASIIYIIVVLVATSVVSPAALSESDAPLLSVMQTAVPQFPLRLFTLIALCAVANTGLANFVTSSRLVYGMSRQGLLPGWLGRVHSKLRTPNTAVVACFCVALGLAVSGSLRQLAAATSCLILAVFFTTNVSLIVIRRRDANQSTSSLVQHSLPYVAAASCVGLLSCAPLAALATAGGLMLAGLLGAWWQRDAIVGDADEARSIPNELEEP